MEPDRTAQGRIFFASFAARLFVIGLFIGTSEGIEQISRDSFWYDAVGQRIADQYRHGEIEWSRWIDDGWYQFVGVVYYLFGPNLLFVLLINAVLAACAAVLAYKASVVVFQSEAVGRASAYAFGLFPSIVYYTSLPLKEAWALFALLSILWGIVRIRLLKERIGILWIAVGLAMLAVIRIYLCYVLSGCVFLCIVPVRLRGGWAGIAQLGVLCLCLGVLVAAVVNTTDMDVNEYRGLEYFDLDYLNHIRVEMNAGNAEMFEHDSQATFGQGWVQDIWNALTGVFYFFLSINIFNITRLRQLAALPEMILFLFCIPYLFTGAVQGWKRIPNRVLPVAMFALVLMVVYGSAATNMGAMYRWRVQALPFWIMLITYGALLRRKGWLSRWLYRQMRGPERAHAGLPSGKRYRPRHASI